MRLLHILCAFVFFLILVPITTVASAQSLLPATGSDTKAEASVKLPEPLSEEAARDLLSKLSDTEVRQLLLERLDAVAKERRGSGGAAPLFPIVFPW